MPGPPIPMIATPATMVEPELLPFTEDELVISYFLTDTLFPCMRRP